MAYVWFDWLSHELIGSEKCNKISYSWIVFVISVM